MSARSETVLDVVLDDATLGPTMAIGSLRCERHGAGEAIGFAYHRDYLEQRRSVAIAPDLPLVAGPSWPAREQALFGIFRDISPDRWGRMLMERREALEAREAKRRLRRLSEWDFLTGVDDCTRMGALRLRRTEPPHAWVDERERSAPPATRLRELEAIARELGHEDAEERPEYARWLAQLMAPGTSMGGARPKATFADEHGALWLAKFPAHDDRRDVGAWEYLAWRLARAAGLIVPDARLLRFGRGYRSFTVRRFDRQGDSRRLYASTMTLTGRNDGEGGSYLDIAQAIQRHGDPGGIGDDLAQLYRRIAFSILIGNRDDHLRNHGFLRTPDGWRLAPAFDINPNPDKREHALAIDAHDPSPRLANLRATHTFYRLDGTQAKAIEAEVRDAVAHWPAIATELKLPRTARDQLAALIGD
ncbi:MULTISPECIES: type II toxin-antitoxin system HipA family toxin [Rhodanobacter]|uniref:type II toxin-antitoxin system HipA family toxin n=1 Tax=Rhodanobacter TaxID=75309 RepID=UPI0003FD9F64|nr:MULTISPECIES: type II toxin-antitoxin system HipA family toxin [Rhodanobacter]TAN15449.1 MAG: type II toxin-antitoxin system HipA family toxin [Rhodanobacter sp.]UJJ55324.1 type II toxin-antitoxin system HipA family toxin [Rhodanobacter thiooxydans]